MIVGPLIAAMLDLVGWWSPFMASAVFGLLALMLLLTGIEETLKHPPECTLAPASEGITAFRNSPQARLSALLIAFAFCIDGFCDLGIRGIHPPVRYGRDGICGSFRHCLDGLYAGRAGVPPPRQPHVYHQPCPHDGGRFRRGRAGITAFVAHICRPYRSVYPDRLFCCIGAMLSVAATLALEALPRNAGMASGIMGSFQIWLVPAFRPESRQGGLTCDPASVGRRMCSPYSGDRPGDTALDIRYCAVISRHGNK